MTEPTTPARTARPVPWLALAAVVALLVPLRAALGPIRDIDVYWHLLVGREILDGVPVGEAGRGWSMAPVADTWVSAQWLAEVVLAKPEQGRGLQELLGCRGAIAGRVDDADRQRVHAARERRGLVVVAPFAGRIGLRRAQCPAVQLDSDRGQRGCRAREHQGLVVGDKIAGRAAVLGDG